MIAKRIAVVALAASLCASPIAAQTVAQLLEKGIYAEETVGDLDTAIHAYRQILAASAPRDIAAQAQLHLTESLRRKGGTANATPGLAQQSSAPCCGIMSQNYDVNQPVVVAGTVTKVEWANPQALVFLDGFDGNKWGFTIVAPNALLRLGLNTGSLRLGEEIVVAGFLAIGGQATPGGFVQCASDNASLGCQTFVNGALHASARTITRADGSPMFDRDAARKILEQQRQP